MIAGNRVFRGVAAVLVTVIVFTPAAVLCGDDAEEIEKLGERFDDQFEAKDYAAAEQTLTRVPALAEKTRPRDSLVLATAAHRQAKLYAATGRDDKAEEMFKQVLDVRQKACDRDAPISVLVGRVDDLVQTLQDLVSFYTNRNRFDQAENVFKLWMAAAAATSRSLSRNFNKSRRNFRMKRRNWAKTTGKSNSGERFLGHNE